MLACLGSACQAVWPLLSTLRAHTRLSVCPLDALAGARHAWCPGLSSHHRWEIPLFDVSSLDVTKVGHAKVWLLHMPAALVCNPDRGPDGASGLWEAAEVVACGEAGANVILTASGRRVRVPHANVAASRFAEGWDADAEEADREPSASRAGDDAESSGSEGDEDENEDGEVGVCGRASMALAAAAAAVVSVRVSCSGTSLRGRPFQSCSLAPISMGMKVKST